MQKEKHNSQKFDALISNRQSRWLEKANWRESNSTWLDFSFAIASAVLREIRKRGMTQKDLADRLGVSPQYVNRLLKGSENLSLETITKLQNVLNLELIKNSNFRNAALTDYINISYKSYLAPKVEVDVKIKEFAGELSYTARLNDKFGRYYSAESEYCEQMVA